MKPKSTVTLMIIILLTAALQAAGQRRLVAVDFDTMAPIAGASVVSSNGNTITDSLGHFSVADSCKTLLFSHVNYESSLVNLGEVRDTVYLFSKTLRVDEVVVFGHGGHDLIPEALKRQLKLSKTDAELAAADPSRGGNLLQLISYIIPKKWRKNNKEERRKRLKQILDDY